MVVIDKVDEAVVDPFVVRNVRVGPMDAHSLAQHLGERPTVTHQIVVAFTGTDLIASKDAILKLFVESTR
jgi:hypothetical protein